MNAKQRPVFSLVMGTIGRTYEFARLLRSLRFQSFRSLELIVVDQNQDNRLLPIIKEYNQYICIKHIRGERGLSRARNIGLSYASGEIIAFPDDDCWYPSDLLQVASDFFKKNPKIHVLTGRLICKDKRSLGLWHKKAGYVDRFNIWWRHRSCSIFLRREVVIVLGGFDERLGVGSDSPLQAGEETDYILRALSNGFRIYYDPNITVFHPREDFSMNTAPLKAFNYSIGIGYILRKHKYPMYFFSYLQLRSMLGILRSIIQGDWARARAQKAIIIGRWKGWFM